MIFAKFLTQSGHLGGGLGAINPPQDSVLQHFQDVLLLNIGNTEQNTVGP